MKSAYFYPTLDCLSTEMFQNLTSKDLNVLNQLFILFRIARRGLTTKHLYIQPSEKYLQSKTHHSIEGISRSISRLVELGIIRRTRRRMRYGRWQTNLYHLGLDILEKVPWLRKYVEKIRSSPFDQKVKLEDKTSLLSDGETEDRISFQEWKRLSGWKGFG